LAKKEGKKISLEFRRLFILVLGFVLIFLGFSIQKSFMAENETPDQKEAVLEELAEIKENESVYEGQLSSLLKQSLEIENELEVVNNRLIKIRENIEKLSEQIRASQINAEMMYIERKRIIADLYILTNDPLYFILSFIDTDQFMEKMHGKDEDSIVVAEKIKKVIEINDQLITLGDDQKRLAVKKKSYQEEVDRLATKAAKIQAEISKKEGALFVLGARKYDLESYLTGLSQINANLKRDFIVWNSAAGPRFEIKGGGTEHGLGLSQYGAKGMARQGKSYQEILKHYYRGIKIGKVKHNPQVRIGIVLSGKGGILEVISGEYKIGNYELGVGDWVNITPSEVNIYQNEKLIKTYQNNRTQRIKPQSSTSIIQVDYKKSYFNKYYGEIKVIKEGNGLVTVNTLPMEEYLKGVVVAEVPYSWPREAIKAQALAARSYAYKHIGSSGNYDMDDSTSYQVYIGAYHRARSNHVIDESRGQVITDQGSIISAYYFSTSGGWTENNENIWGGRPIAYLRGVESTWEDDSPWWTWYTKRYSRKQISKLLASLKIGQVKKIEVKARGVSGRVLAIKIVGDQGVRVISGARFKKLINIPLGPEDEMMRSTLFGIRSVKD